MLGVAFWIERVMPWKKEESFTISFAIAIPENFLFQSNINTVAKTDLSEDIWNKASPLRQPGDENNLSELGSR